MSKSFKIRDIVAERGTKVSGFLTIQDDPAGTYRMLVGIINGSDTGPVFCITGGMYGTQYPGINACIRIYNEMDPKVLRGTVITVPVIEIPGFQKCMDKSPIDGLSPNQVFPGDPKGTISHRIAYTVFNEVIKKSNYHLDLRGGELWEALQTFSICHETDNKDFDSKTEELAKILGTKVFRRTRARKGSLIYEACNLGIYSIILLAYKGLARNDEDNIQSCIRGIYNLLKYLEMVEGNLNISYEPKEMSSKRYNIKAKQGGLLYLQHSPGEIVSKGQKLGEIRNLKGEIVQELLAPIDGIIHSTFPKHIKQPGEQIIGMRRIIS